MNDSDDVPRSSRAAMLDFPGADELLAAAKVPPVTAAAVNAAVTAVAGRVAAEQVTELRTRVPLTRRLLVAAAAVATLTTGAVAYPVLDLGRPPAQTASAADFLHDMAETAGAARPSQAPYWKVRTKFENEDDGTGTSTLVFDRAGTIWTQNSLSPGYGVVSGKKMRWLVGEDRLTWDQLDALPSDPDALADRFGDNPFGSISGVLADSPASPALRSALFDVLARTEGARLLKNVKDSMGRPGTAIETTIAADPHFGIPAITIRVVIDRASGSILEESHRSDRGGVDWRTYLESGPASSRRTE
ncbi:hypothetical protein AB0I93_19925 [Streptomyces sp. NPDC049967]|uniref:hypothetical protein n=2 Tax=unclassified Streptomyces TaxID=2593676 RepID=UPI002E152E0D|nr:MULTISPECIES: hypothetical protein [unclassified Streptomyces]WSJ26261.1 hypothetical protein OG384_31930 [Streptomyces sp. NBC_01324]